MNSDELRVEKEVTHREHWKWLIGLLGGVLIVMQAFTWMEARIERQATERVTTAMNIARIENGGRDGRIWIDGRINTLNAELDSLRRELSLLRQEIHQAGTARQTPRPSDQ